MHREPEPTTTSTPDDRVATERWSALWTPTTGPDEATGGLVDDDGFLREPDDWIIAHTKRTIGPLGDFDGDRCVVLLGDAGAGKTWALESQLDRLDRPAALRRLAAYGEGRVPIERLFQGHEFERWRESAGPLVLLLDALDESPYPPELASDILLEGLKGLDLARLWVRVTMRPVAWTPRVREALDRLFGPVRVLDLLPLRRSLVAALLPAGMPAVDALCTHNLGPLLARPLTLRLLLDGGVGEGGALSHRLWEVYDRALRHRCDRALGASKPIGSRVERVEQIQRVVDLLGALTVLGGCGVFAVAPTLDGSTLDVSRGLGARLTEAVDALEHGPFTGARSARQWEHATFAEFHAARWIGAHASSAEEKARWLTGPEGSLDALPVPVQGTAAWLGAESEDFFEHILARAPNVLLGADAASLKGDRAVRLLRAILDDTNTVRRGSRLGQRALTRLRGEGVDELLANRIADPGAPAESRKRAMEIAMFSGGAKAVDAALVRTLDDAEAMETRVAAARVVEEQGGESARLALRPLATGIAGDERDDLKGLALLALWRGPQRPRALVTHEEMLGYLTKPRRPDYFGAYRRVRSEFLQDLKRHELPATLIWAIDHVAGPETDDLSTESELTDLMRRAWACGADTSIADPLARLATAWTRRHHHFPLPPAPLTPADVPIRRAVVSALVPIGATDDRLIWDLPRLLEESDLPWLMGNTMEHDLDAEGPIWARLSFDRFRAAVESEGVGPPGKPDPRVALIEEYCDLRGRFVTFESESRWYFEEGVLLDSEGVRMQRELSTRQRVRASEIAASQTLLRAKVETELTASRNDPGGHFWQLVHWLCARPLPGERFVVQPNVLITETEGWKASDKNRRDELLSLAHRYVLTGQPEPDVWYGQQKRHYPARAGYLALRLLAEVDPALLDTLPGDVWARWMPVLIDSLPDGTDPPRELLLRYAAASAHDAFVTWVEREFDSEVAQHRNAFVLDRVPAKGDVTLADRFLPRLHAGLPGPAIGTLLPVVHGARPLETVRAAWTLTNDPERERVEAAITFLLQVDGPRAWPWLIGRSKDDPSLGTTVIEAMSFGFSRDQATFSTLPVRTLADIWKWAVAQWPYREWEGVRSVVSGDELVGKALSAIEQAASAPATSAEALSTLRELAATPAAPDWLGHIAVRAERTLRLRRWRPWAVGDLLRAP